MKKIIIVLICLSFLNSCKKNEENSFIKTKPIVSETKSNIKEQTTSLQNSSNGPYTQIFNQINPGILLQVINSNNTSVANQIINSLANEIDNLYFQSHETTLYQEFSGDRDKVLLFGLFMAKKEQGGYIISNATPGVNCFLTAVSTLIGITEAKNIWASIQAGASAETVVAALKLIAKRVAGVITVCIMVYEVGDCLDWW